MNDDLKAELTAIRESMTAGFARVDRYFELQQAQHLELRGEVRELRGEVRELRAMLEALTRRVDAIESRLSSVEEAVQRLDSEVRALRDWCTREFSEVRRELRQLRLESAGRDATLRQDFDALSARVDRLEEGIEER